MSDNQAAQDIYQFSEFMLKQCEEIFYVALSECDNLEYALEKAIEWLVQKQSATSKEIKYYEQYEKNYFSEYVNALSENPRDEEKCQIFKDLYDLNHSKLMKAKSELQAAEIINDQLHSVPNSWQTQTQTQSETIQFSQTVRHTHHKR